MKVSQQRRSVTRGHTSCTSELLEPRLTVRLRARGRRLKLDRVLAAGADPSASPLLAARAAQLVEPCARQRIAACLEQFAFAAEQPSGRSKTLPLLGAVRPNQETLLELARMLREPQLHYAHGIAMLELILADGTGPAYTDATGERLAQQLAVAAQGLSGGIPRVSGQ